MAAHQCHALLARALPRLGMRPAGFEKVRRQVCKRLDRRRQDLGLGSMAEYWERLEQDADEWAVLDRLCRITISRFYRDASMWDSLRTLLPDLSLDGAPVRCWSAGAASGEEAWTLRLIAHFDASAPEVRVLGTDADAHMVGRARAARYPPGSLRELPAGWREEAFHRSADGVRLHDAFRDHVEFRVADLRLDPPSGPFDLVLCRNLAFTYFDSAGQARALTNLMSALRPGGVLAVGKPEAPPEHPRLEAIVDTLGLYRVRIRK